MKEKITVIGAGSWGSTLALVLNDNNHDVCLYMRRNEQKKELEENSTNSKYLKNIIFPKTIIYTTDLRKAVEFSNIIVLSITAQATREYLKKIKPFLKKNHIIVNVSKGIELESNKLISQIYDEIIGDDSYVVLSGPSHAEELSLKMPTAIVSSSKNIKLAEKIQDIFSNNYLRVYTNSDVLGVELGGALKNIISLGSGIIEGVGYGDNTRAGIITRGIHEITKMGVFLGAKEETFQGLSGIGDLIVTATSKHSRNKTAGYYIGKGFTLEQVQQKVGMVIEGISTTKAAFLLSQKANIDMPITKAIYDVIYNKINIQDCIIDIMNRNKKAELIREEKY